jgi:hypothetical protein
MKYNFEYNLNIYCFNLNLLKQLVFIKSIVLQNSNSSVANHINQNHINKTINQEQYKK